jgi:RimJ/RimL family protein N-acetyltransferase
VALRTPRLLLRPYRPGDARMYATMHQQNREHLREFLPAELRDMRTEQDAEAQIERMGRQWRRGELFIFGAWEQATGIYVGETYLANAEWAVPSVELGYFTVAAHTSQGYAVEAGRAVVRFAFDVLKVERIDLQCASDNMASARVAERLGFRLEGRQRLRLRKRDSTLVDRVWYGLLRAERGG